MTAQAGEVEYVMGRSHEETARLQRQAALFGPFTRWVCRQAGIGSGMRVLDVGSGAGDVALLAADLVGPGGAVIGVDANPAVLETARARAAAAGHRQVSFLAGDIRQVLPEGPFDAIVGRLVLPYIPDPAALLGQLVSRLRPGGVVAFVEPALPDQWIAFPSFPLIEQYARWAHAVFAGAGADVYVGAKLVPLFEAAGLAVGDQHFYAPVGGGPDWAGYEWLAASLRSTLPLLERFGIATAAEVDVETIADRFRQEVVARNGLLGLVPHVGAWGRLA